MSDGSADFLIRLTPMEAEPLADDLPRGHARVQGRVGVLKDHLHARGKPAMVLRPVALGQGFALEADGAAGLLEKP